MNRSLHLAALGLFPWALVAIAALPSAVGLPTLYVSLIAGSAFSLWAWLRAPAPAVLPWRHDGEGR